MLEQTQEFERQQLNVQNRLKIVTSSDTPEEATRRLKKPLEKLRKVELAENYIGLLETIESLKHQARSHLPEDPKEALKPYSKLKQMAMVLPDLQEQAEGAAVHLVRHVQKSADELWVEMKKIMLDEFEAVLKKSKWPEPTSKATAEWSDSFEKLLDLQMPEIMSAREPLVLLPMSVMAKPFMQQFRYHFFSDKPTNHPNQVCAQLKQKSLQLNIHSLGITTLNGFWGPSRNGKAFFEKTLVLFSPAISKTISTLGTLYMLIQ